MARPTLSYLSNFCACIAAYKAINQAALTSPSIEHIDSCVDSSHIRMTNALTCTLKLEHRCDKKGMLS
ncbi:hypothetical protein NYA30BAC_01302 [Halomonas sp. NYA30]